ncbi:MAG: UDP-N-acetylmuramate dehydrogenase [Acidobacteriota bacterium]
MRLSEQEWVEIFKGIYQGEVGFDIPMKEYTNLLIGGPADVFLRPEDPLSIRNLMVTLKKKNVPFFTLGGGTNVLVRDGGIEGVVLSLKEFRRIEVLKEAENYAELFVEAGVPLQKLVNFCKERGYAGVEGLTGIPGSVGGAICGNAGSYGCEMKDTLVSVAIMDASGRLDRFKAEGLGFGYRRSGIVPTDIVLSANIKLGRDEKEAVAVRTENFFTEKKQTQPIAQRSAGCVFKNPEGASAGRLIDEAGCKGLKVGGVEVSPVHANFFVNTGAGTASDYLELMDRVSSAVHKRFGLALEPEVRVVGRE